jgi:subtilisin family serine protease
MKTNKIILLLILFFLLNGKGRASTAAAEPPTWLDKVAPQVLTAAENGETEFLVLLRDQADLNLAADLPTKEEKGTYVFATLTAFAEANQKPLRKALDTLGAVYQPFWITNMIWVRGDVHALQQIARREDVARIEANSYIPLSLPGIDSPTPQPQAIDGIEWNISKINAPLVWSLGYTGDGIVVGGQDTGYDWDHAALINAYRGWDGATADHNYNWHDAITTTLEPVDPHGHGTHTMGTMVGDDGGDNRIGVAPGAKWIGCRNMDGSGRGSQATYIECYQWFIAPTDLNGENPDPSKAPHVINNSWSCPVSEGCSDPNILLPAVQAVRAAGIITVHSAGNEGSACYTVAEPAAIYDESFTIGATYSDDTITGFSSRGSVTIDGSNRIKPNVTAPGYSIRSSYPGDFYGYSSGTSMASPHVAGLVALLLSANPHLMGQVEQVETLIENTALPLTTTQECGGVPGSAIPNNTYGYGRVDAWAALKATQSIFYYPAFFSAFLRE